MDLRTLVQNTPARGGNSTWVAARSTPDGAQYVAPWQAALAIEGRLFGSNHGVLTTPLTFLVYAANRPDAWVRVPDATAIFPLSVAVILEDAAGTDTEVRVSIAQNDIGNGTSTASTGPLNLRTDAPVTSNCVVRHLATGDTTAETNPFEIYRAEYGTAEAASTGPQAIWTADKAGFYPLIIGAGSLIVYVAATTTQATGFVQCVWAEFTESSLAV